VDDVLKVNVAKVRILEIGYRTGGGAVPREGLMLTQDENIVDVRLAVQYQISNARNFLFKVKNPVNAPDETIKQVAESALREVVGKSDMDFVITRGRKEISDRTADLIQNTLNEYESGIEIRSVNFQEAQPPGYVQAAFDDAVKSREDRERFINEANAYRNEVLPRAKGESARIMEDAEGYRARVVSEAEGDASRFLALFEEYEKAPEVTRQRLYIDAMKNVLSASGKVMIDLNRDNNLIVLPLDNLGRGSEDISSRILGAGVIQNSMNRDTDKQEVPAPEAQRLRRDIRQREVR
jgi:membrane protease subunit HflK